MPSGVPTATPMTVMIKLPAIAFKQAAGAAGRRRHLGENGERNA